MNSSALSFYEANPLKEMLIDSIPESFVSSRKTNCTYGVLKEALTSESTDHLCELFRLSELDILQQIFEIAFVNFFSSKGKKTAKAHNILRAFQQKKLKKVFTSRTAVLHNGKEPSEIATDTLAAFLEKIGEIRAASATAHLDAVQLRVRAAVRDLTTDFVASLDPRFPPVRALGLWVCDSVSADRYSLSAREFSVEESAVREIEAGELRLLFLLIRVPSAEADDGEGGDDAAFFSSVQISSEAPIALSDGIASANVPGIRDGDRTPAPTVEAPLFVAEPVDASATLLSLRGQHKRNDARAPRANNVITLKVSLNAPCDSCIPTTRAKCAHFFSAILSRRVSVETLVKTVARGDNPHAAARISLASLFGANTSGEVESLGAAPPRCLQLTCPLSHGAIDIPVRGPACTHIPCFDMRFYVEFALSHRFFNCPICQKPAPACMLKMDVYARDLITRGYRERVHLDPLTGDPTELPPPPPASESDREDEDDWFVDSDAEHMPTSCTREDAVKTRLPCPKGACLPKDDPARVAPPETKKPPAQPALTRRAASPAGTQGTVEEPIDID
eukprot:gnl/Chilomastix_cuspidata/4820.p1 GENE.gnl/Chilomastix_cuspidata/4820~~gnl/Chilomastix_cuspidata/4820.p1  ORF type:complete len:563 (+),score=136.78 gnl/Chilomastix_cuspidata/4820:78-1766(+)